MTILHSMVHGMMSVPVDSHGDHRATLGGSAHAWAHASGTVAYISDTRAHAGKERTDPGSISTHKSGTRLNLCGTTTFPGGAQLWYGYSVCRQQCYIHLL